MRGTSQKLWWFSDQNCNVCQEFQDYQMDGAKDVAVITAVVVPSYCFISVHLQAGVY